jgi:hypothetical protein
LRRTAVAALEQLAARADRESNHPASVHAWTRLTELDPLSGRFASGLMRALAATGDRASALAHARRHEADVRRELQTDPDAAVRNLSLVLRSTLTNPEPTKLSHVADQAVMDSLVAPATRTTTSRRRSWPILLATAIVLAITVALVRGRGSDPAPILAVGTIRTPESADSSALGLVLRDMLATTLVHLR